MRDIQAVACKTPALSQLNLSLALPMGRFSVKGIKLNHIEPGEPYQNAYIERFNRTYRHEVLDAYVLKSIEQVQHITEDWLRIYNEQRPHDALSGLPPKQFLPRLTTAAASSNRLST